MRIAVGLMTYNAYSTGRGEMFEKSLEILRKEFSDVLVYTYGSTDGTGQRVEELGGKWTRAINPDMPTRYSAGYKELGDMLYDTGADILFVTADDILYKPGIASALENWWLSAPHDIAITSWIMEPEYTWNFFRAYKEYAGIRGLSRASVPGCSWSFRREDWQTITKRPLFEDIGTCNDFISRRRHVVQIDWGDHVGEKQSAWGNESWKRAIPFDPNTAHEHQWRRTNLRTEDGMRACFCLVPGCSLGLLVAPDGRVVGLQENAFALMTPVGPMKIEDDPTGPVDKGVLTEVTSVYDLDKLGEDVWKDCVFVDIGAHVGIVSTWVAMVHPDVPIYAYEPDSENFARELRNFKANVPEHANIHPHNVAVTGNGRSVYLRGERWDNSGGLTIYARGGSKVLREVESTTLSKIFDELPPHKHLVLKIDCEGAEHEILSPPMDEFVSKNVDHLCIEFHDIRANGWKAETLKGRMVGLMGEDRVHYYMIEDGK